MCKIRQKKKCCGEVLPNYKSVVWQAIERCCQGSNETHGIELEDQRPILKAVHYLSRKPTCLHSSFDRSTQMYFIQRCLSSKLPNKVLLERTRRSFETPNSIFRPSKLWLSSVVVTACPVGLFRILELAARSEHVLVRKVRKVKYRNAWLRKR